MKNATMSIKNTTKILAIGSCAVFINLAALTVYAANNNEQPTTGKTSPSL